MVEAWENFSLVEERCNEVEGGTGETRVWMVYFIEAPCRHEKFRKMKSAPPR